jgi:PmbA protein
MTALDALAAEALDRFKGRGAGAEAEVYLSRSEDRSLARREGALDVVEAGESVGCAVRVLRDGRAGFAAAGGASPELLDELHARALAQLPHAEPEKGRRLPEPGGAAGDAALEATLWDDSLFTRSWVEVEQRLAEAEAAARSEKRVRRVLRAEYGESRGEVCIANSRGLLRRERGGSAHVSVAAAAEAGAETHVGESFLSHRLAAKLDFAAAGREAAFHAAALLGAGAAPAGRRPVVFHSRVGAEFLELIAELLSAEEVQAGRSLLAGRLGQAAASPLVTLRDEPRRPYGPASAAVDDEGLPTADRAMIEKGTLRDLFHDTLTAAREGHGSNGCAYRGSYEDPPSPGPSNLILAPGADAPESLLAAGKGLLVLDVLGMHMVDPVSGEFSVGVSGLLTEKGRAGKPFKGAMLSGNLVDLLRRVDGVASDLAFHGSFASPSFRVSSLDVAAG